MNLEIIDQTLAVSPQLQPADIKAIFDLGYKSIICNRPDQEEAQQPDFDSIEKQAAQFQMECVYLPVVPGDIRQEHGQLFADAMQTLTLPAVAYCRTGKRAVSLWQLANAQAG